MMPGPVIVNVFKECRVEDLDLDIDIEKKTYGIAGKNEVSIPTWEEDGVYLGFYH